MSGDAPSVYSCEVRKARKEHKCCECNRTIKIRYRYQMFKGIWDGKAARFKTCNPCALLRDEIAQDSYDHEAPAFGELGEYARELDMEFPPVDE
jgi:hypothetical protein